MSLRIGLAVCAPLFVFAAACTFPDIQVGAGGSGGSKASTVGATGSSSSSASVSGSVSSASASGSATSSSSTGLSACQMCLGTSQCDCDGDTVPRYDVAHGCMGVSNDPAKSDCDDCNMDVHPGQMGYFTAAISGTNFDYDCSGANDPKYSQGSCTSLGVLGMGGCAHDFADAAAKCGEQVVVDHCANPGGLATKCVTGSSDSLPMMPCH